MSFDLPPHKVTHEEFKGNPLFKIVKIDDEGNELEKYGTAVSFGLTKAKYILEHVEDIKKFVEEFDKKKED